MYRKVLHILITFSILFPPSGTALSQERPKDKGKWDGDVSLDGATNFHFTPLKKRSHNLGNVSARVGYSIGGFSFDVSSKLSLEHKITGNAGGNIRTENGDTTRQVDAAVKTKSYISSISGISISYYTNPANRFKAYYNYSFSKTTPSNYNLNTDSLTPEEVQFSYTRESGNSQTGKHKTGINYEHDFVGIGATLRASADMVFYADSDYKEWTTGNGKGDTQLSPEGKELNVGRHYRTTPTSDYGDYLLQIKYSDKAFCTLKNLDVDFSLSYHLKNLKDHQSAANYIDGQWRDSTSFRTNFRYRTATLSPLVRVRYTAGIYRLDLTYSPESFVYQLDGDEHEGDIDKGSVTHLVKMINTFNPWKGHSFALRWGRSEERPGYLQVCWFPRSGDAYSNELYMGNPDVKTCITTTGNLSYEYTRKRFSLLVDLGCVYKPRQIAKTYSNEVIDDREYRVYTWVNGGHSTEGDADLTLGWKDGGFDAALNGHFNIYKGYSMSGKVTKSNSYSISAKAAYSLKTWEFRADAKYSSGVSRTYYSITSLVDCNLKVTKTFGKHFRVFLEGKDLLDRPVTLKTVSDDEKEIRYERHNDYKRLLRIGVTYKF